MTQPRHRIVVALDLGQYSEIVLEHALDQAARHPAPDLHFLTVLERAADVDRVKDQLAALVLPALETLDRADWQVRLHVRTGEIADVIATIAGEVRAHLVVIGRFGVHHPRRHLAKMASDILDVAPCPVLVVGLSESPEKDAQQCAECATVRSESEGARWFCARHTGDRARISTLVPFGSGYSGGGLLW